MEKETTRTSETQETMESVIVHSIPERNNYMIEIRRDREQPLYISVNNIPKQVLDRIYFHYQDKGILSNEEAVALASVLRKFNSGERSENVIGDIEEIHSKLRDRFEGQIGTL